jgi:hypothetical protein
MGDSIRVRGDPLFHGKPESKRDSWKRPGDSGWRVPSEADRACLVRREFLLGRGIVAAFVWVYWLSASEPIGGLTGGVSKIAVLPIALMSSCGSSDDPVNIQRSLTREWRERVREASRVNAWESRDSRRFRICRRESTANVSS